MHELNRTMNLPRKFKSHLPLAAMAMNVRYDAMRRAALRPDSRGPNLREHCRLQSTAAAGPRRQTTELTAD